MLHGRAEKACHCRDVEVTDADGPVRPTVTQVFCSALPVASLILECAFEATPCATVGNA